jgi:hypothetical protein
MNRMNIEKMIKRNDTVQELALLRARLDENGQRLREAESRRNEYYDNFRVAAANAEVLEQEVNTIEVQMRERQLEVQRIREELENLMAKNRKNENRNYVILFCAYFVIVIFLCIKKITTKFHKMYVVDSKELRRIIIKSIINCP